MRQKKHIAIRKPDTRNAKVALAESKVPLLHGQNGTLDSESAALLNVINGQQGSV